MSGIDFKIYNFRLELREEKINKTFCMGVLKLYFGKFP